MLHPLCADCILSDRAHNRNIVYHKRLGRFKWEFVVSLLHLWDILRCISDIFKFISTFFFSNCEQDCATAIVLRHKLLLITALSLLHREEFNDLNPTTPFYSVSTPQSCLVSRLQPERRKWAVSCQCEPQCDTHDGDHLNNSWKFCSQRTLGHWEGHSVFGVCLCISVGMRWPPLSWLFNQVPLSVLWLS